MGEATMTRAELVEKIARVAHEAFPIGMGEAVLRVIHDAGFAVVRQEMPRERDEKLWSYLRPYHDIQEDDMAGRVPSDFFRLAWRQELRVADLAKEDA